MPFVVVATIVAVLVAAEPATQSAQEVGSVFGSAVAIKKIDLALIAGPNTQLNPNKGEDRKRLRDLSEVFAKPILLHFAADQQIDATGGEVADERERSRKQAAIWALRMDNQIKRVNEMLAIKRITDADRRVLKQELREGQAKAEYWHTREKDGASDLELRETIVLKKVEKRLYDIFGGRVINSEGPQAIDARRKLFEQTERNGDLVFTDLAVRRLVYSYFDLPNLEISARMLEN